MSVKFEVKESSYAMNNKTAWFTILGCVKEGQLKNDMAYMSDGDIMRVTNIQTKSPPEALKGGEEYPDGLIEDAANGGWFSIYKANADTGEVRLTCRIPVDGAQVSVGATLEFEESALTDEEKSERRKSRMLVVAAFIFFMLAFMLYGLTAHSTHY